MAIRSISNVHIGSGTTGKKTSPILMEKGWSEEKKCSMLVEYGKVYDVWFLLCLFSIYVFFRGI